MVLKLSMWICIVFTAPVLFTFSHDCLKNSKNYKCRLGSTTPYRFIANIDDSELSYPECTEKKIWLIFRHGTRNPSKKYVPLMSDILPKVQQLIIDNYNMNKTSLSSIEVANLTSWEFNITLRQASKLVKEGEDEMIDLGERYQARFPSLMPEIYSNQSYRFKYTSTQRTEESAKHFAVGLFGWQRSKNVHFPEPDRVDAILRFYKRCQRWRKEIDKNPNADQERIEFLKTKAVAKMLRAISKRLGLNIDYETANLMRLMCAFETSWYTDYESPWCNMFSSDDFKVLEFAEDLKYYWIEGYGYSLNYEQACPVLEDMFKFFQSDEAPRVTAYFTHSGAILKILALLGVYKDTQPLTHDSYASYGSNRMWRTSLIDSFASNIAFILYDCLSNGPSILAMHQERVIRLPGCPDNMPCPMSVMKKLYPDNEKECLFDDMCSL